MHYSNQPGDDTYTSQDVQCFPSSHDAQANITGRLQGGFENTHSRNEHTSSTPSSTNPSYYCLSLFSSSPAILPLQAPSLDGSAVHGTSYPQSLTSTTIESPEYLAHRLLVEFGKTRTNYNSLVPRIVEVMRLFRDFGPPRCPVPVVSNLEELLNDEALNRIEHRYPNSLDAGFLVLCTERRALRSGGGGKYYFMDTSGRLVGCHKSDLSNYADKGVLCGPVLLKNLIFVFIMRGTFGLDPRCKSSNPQRLLEYYENLAKEGRVMDVQRLVRVWSMEIFPETPYDGGFPHCSLLWVKRMHVGAHIIKWKRSQWHSNQLRIHDYYSSNNQQAVSKRPMGSVSQPLLINQQQMCPYYGRGATTCNVPQDTSSHHPEHVASDGAQFESSMYQKGRSVKRRRLTDENRPYFDDLQSYQNTFATTPELQSTSRQYDVFSETPAQSVECTSLYMDSLDQFSLKSNSECTPTCSHKNLTARQASKQSGLTERAETPPLEHNDLKNVGLMDDTASDFWMLSSHCDSATSASRTTTPRMPTILTSGFPSMDEFYPASFSTAASIPSDYQNHLNTARHNINADTNPSKAGAAQNILSYSVSLQSLNMEFDEIFSTASTKQLSEWCIQALDKLDDSFLSAAAPLLLSNDEANNMSHEAMRKRFSDKLCEPVEPSVLKECLRVLLTCSLQQYKLHEEHAAYTDGTSTLKNSKLKSSADSNLNSFSNQPNMQVNSKDESTLGDQSRKLIAFKENPDDTYSTFYVDSQTTPSVRDAYMLRSSALRLSKAEGSTPMRSDSSTSSPYYLTNTPYPMRVMSANNEHYEDPSMCNFDQEYYERPFSTSAANCDQLETSYIDPNQRTTYQNAVGYYHQDDRGPLSLESYCTEIFERHKTNDDAVPPGESSQMFPSIEHSSKPQSTTLLESINHYSDYDNCVEDQAAKLMYDNSSPALSQSSAALYQYRSDQPEVDICDDVDICQLQSTLLSPPPPQNEKRQKKSRYQ